MKRLLTLWRCQVQEYIWWYLIASFVVIMFVACGMSYALSLPEIRVVFTSINLWIVIRGILRELWCFALILICSVHICGAPVAACVLILRAYTIGFAWGWWLSTLGFGGFLTFLIFLLPQGIIVLCCLTGATCVGLAHCFRFKPLDRRTYIITIFYWSIPAFGALILEWLAVAFMIR